MKVRSLMTEKVRVASPTTAVTAVGTMMLQAGCGAVPVVDERGEPLGMITDRDICLALVVADRRPSEMTVREVMTQGVATCRADDDVEAALHTMARNLVRRLPVVDELNRLEGILSIDDVVLSARALGNEAFTGPFYSDVAKALQAICAQPTSGPLVKESDRPGAIA